MAASVYTVGQVNRYIKNMFAQDYALQRIFVRGEISNLKYHTSGHIYFSLKDETGTLKGVMFRSQAARLKMRLVNGMRVVASGSINVFERDGAYQLYAEAMEPDGKGALAEAYEKLKQELEEMGMFAQEYKQPIPKYARKIGVVTAATGAALRDICNITARRNPCVTLYLYPALVQGAMASASIAYAISVLDQMDLDVIIVGRGGGSIEDLWAFNERETAEAIFNCETPVISAVGHETDFTIADFVADMRAPTPSAAAELAVFDLKVLLDTLQSKEEQLNGAMDQRMYETRMRLSHMEKRLHILAPENQLEKNKERLAYDKQRLQLAMEQKIKELRQQLTLYTGKLDLLSPLRRLSGGFAYVQDEAGNGVAGVEALQKGNVVTLHFADGEAKAEIINTQIRAES